MIKRLLCVFMCVLYFSTLNVYADNVDNNVKPDYFDSKMTFTVNDNGSLTNKTIDVYNRNGAAYISMRDFFESLGGSVSYNYDPKSYQLGTIKVFGKRFDYYSHFPMEDYYIPGEMLYGKEDSFPIVFYMVDNDKAKLIGMSSMVEALFTKYVDGRIYVPINSFRSLMPKTDHIVAFDFVNKQMVVNNYSLEKEKEIISGLVKEDLVQDYYKYREDFELIDGRTERLNYKFLYYSNDIYDDQLHSTLVMESMYYDRYGNRPLINDEKTSADYFRAFCRLDDEKVFVVYNSDLDGYIVSNFEFETDHEFVKGDRLLIIRRSDNMIIFDTLYLKIR